MSTATAVPVTKELEEREADEALATLRERGSWRLLLDAVDRFRAADGFSHSRALAFSVVLALFPALIAVVALAEVSDQESFRLVLQETIDELAPGPAGEVLTQAIRQGSGEDADDVVAIGVLAAITAGTGAMGQVERGANRIYGVELDRPLPRKYLRGLLLALTAGVAAIAASVCVVAGAALGEAAGESFWGEALDDAWDVVRWPLGAVLAIGAVAVLFRFSPRRRQPDVSWLAFGSGLSTVLGLLFTGGLALYLEQTRGFGETYGPLAGFVGVLLWAFGIAVALFLGLAFAAQLEALRAGVPHTRTGRTENEAERVVG